MSVRLLKMASSGRNVALAKTRILKKKIGRFKRASRPFFFFFFFLVRHFPRPANRRDHARPTVDDCRG